MKVSCVLFRGYHFNKMPAAKFILTAFVVKASELLLDYDFLYDIRNLFAMFRCPFLCLSDKYSFLRHTPFVNI
jgi:hypothetical protein